MDGFARIQRGEAGDITAGLSLGPWTEEIARRLMAQNEIAWNELGTPAHEREAERKKFAELYRKHIEAGDPNYPYVPYPYIEWYSKANGRVVLELDPSQVEILDGEVARDRRRRPKTPLLNGNVPRPSGTFWRIWFESCPMRTASRETTLT